MASCRPQRLRRLLASVREELLPEPEVSARGPEVALPVPHHCASSASCAIQRSHGQLDRVLPVTRWLPAGSEAPALGSSD